MKVAKSFMLAAALILLFPAGAGAQPGYGGLGRRAIGRARIHHLRITPVVKAVKRVSPAVVNIFTQKQVYTNPFGRSPYYRGYQTPYYLRRKVRSLGSGVIINGAGYAVTNEHVVTRATEIRVQLADKRVFKAKVIGADRRFDLAVIKILTRSRLPYAVMGKSSDLMAGETVIAIGNPFGLSHTVSVGVISALKRRLRIKTRVYEDFIQTDAAINPGNSGGPLLNILGQLVGINTAIHKGGRGIGFAIPVDRVKQAVKDLLRYGRVRGGYLGISVRPYRGYGLWVTSVAPNGPAARAGIRAGDVILKVRRQNIKTGQDFTGAVSRMIPGERVRFKLRRGIVNVKVGAYSPKIAWNHFQLRLGVRVADALKNRKRYRLRATRGVVLTWVRQGGLAYNTGLRARDVILSLNQYATYNLSQLYGVTARLRVGTSLVMTVQRGTGMYRLTLNY